MSSHALDPNRLSPGGAPASHPRLSDPCPPLESRLSTPSSSRSRKPPTPALGSVRSSPSTHSTAAAHKRPPPIRRARDIALDFWEEKDESVTAEEFIRMHEPVAHTPCEKAASILYDNLYRRHAGLQVTAADPVAVNPVATSLSEIVGEPRTCITYPNTKPTRTEEEENEEMVDVDVDVDVDMTPRPVSPVAKRHYSRGKKGKILGLV
ncbi:hypothetical protein Q9L58_002141 [Maublancomyces gigas]|uniref:Uncharacterized protein n=1 Tax=Discina gigas TaxID=1032678 RepID=A0ABR3GSN1_9PEZI